MTFDILPAIDLRGGRVVRLRQGDFTRETSYAQDPSAAAAAFAAAGAHWLHVVDLDGARSGIPGHGRTITEIVDAAGERLQVEVGGGLRDESAVAQALGSGATRVVIGTAALRDPAFVGRIVAAYGSSRVAVAIDVRDGLAVGEGWATGSPGIDVAVAIERLADVGLTTFEVTAIERDGLLEGPDLRLYERLVRLDRGDLVASGGITTLRDIAALREVGCRGGIVGRAFHEGRLDLTDALAFVASLG